MLYDCNAYALEWLNREERINPPLRVYDIHSWGEGNSELINRRIRYFSDPEFVASQPILKGAKDFVRRLCDVAEVFFVSAVPPACMSARALRLRRSSGEIGGLSDCSGRVRDCGGRVRVPEPAERPEYLGSLIELLLRNKIALYDTTETGKLQTFLSKI